MNRRGRRGEATSSERGTVLLLVPAAVFILCVLGAIVVDSAHATMRRRELQHAADAAANDVAALAIDPAALRTGIVVLDPARAQEVAEASLDAQQVRGLAAVRVRLEGAGTVVVELEAAHPSVFARSIPGAPRTIRVPARARATALVAGESAIPR